jgi:hypothetical protein
MAFFKSICLFAVSCLLAHGQTPLLNANFSSPNGTVPMIINNSQQPNFTLFSPFFDCSLSRIFTYWQSDADLAADTPTNISIANALPATVTLTTKYNTLKPFLSNGSCPAPGCTLMIQNRCQPPIHYLNYFDIFEVGISSGGQQFSLSYYVYCQESYSQNTLEWGLILEILLVTGMIAVVAMYSNPWSLGGRGIEINYWLIGAFLGVLAFGALVAYLSTPGIIVCLYILSFLLGIVSTAICANELLFLLRAKPLGRVMFVVDNF